MNATVLAACTALLLGVGALLGAEPSGADFTDSSRTTSVATASGDWTAPTVAVEPLPADIAGTQVVTATVTDRSGIADITLEYAAAGSNGWTELVSGCTNGGGRSPMTYSCRWETTLVADGDYRIRATATDTAPEPHTAISSLVTTHVDNGLRADLGPVPSVVSGSVALSASAVTSGSATTRVSIERLDGDRWVQVVGCSEIAASLACTWDTTTVPSGNHRVRARADAGERTVASDPVDVVVDNVAPTVDSLTVPAGVLTGTVPLDATATDLHTSVASVSFTHRLQGTSAWAACGADGDAPYTCDLDTTGLAAGTYEIRAVATDRAGNASAAGVVTRSVSNVPASVTVTNPSAGYVRGSLEVAATVTSSGPVSAVRIEIRATPSGSFTTLCTDDAAPYTCAWDTTDTAYGVREVRAVATLSQGSAVSSPPVAVTVDNRVLAAADVQAGNANGTPGAGDSVTLTYTGLVDLSSIRSGFSGASTAVSGLVLQGGGATAPDRLVFPSGLNLGEVRFAQDYVSGAATITLTGSTISATTVTVGGLPVTQVTVVLGTVAPGSPRTSTTPGALVWAPSTAVRNQLGLASTGASVTESGVSDADL